MAKRLRKDVTPIEKVRYLQMAHTDMTYGKENGLHFKTDLAGVACQFSRNPRLKREDFLEIMPLTLNEIFNNG